MNAHEITTGLKSDAEQTVMMAYISRREAIVLAGAAIVSAVAAKERGMVVRGAIAVPGTVVRTCCFTGQEVQAPPYRSSREYEDQSNSRNPSLE